MEDLTRRGSHASARNSSTISPRTNYFSGDKSAKRKSKYLIIFLGICALGFLASTIFLLVSDNSDEEKDLAAAIVWQQPPNGENICAGKKPDLPNLQCVIDQVYKTGEQAATNVTKGYNGLRNTTAIPITIPFYQAGLCPVNVHWHFGTEHYSKGQYDENGKGPLKMEAKTTRLGFQCHFYDESDVKFTNPYDWKYCKDMKIGATYEVHWPHSAAGACGTPN